MTSGLVVPFLVGLALAVMSGWVAQRARRPSALNYRGRRLPLVLGSPLAGSLVLAVWVTLLSGVSASLVEWGGVARASSSWRQVFWILVASALVFLAGFFDDVRGGPVRGLARHARRLLHGEVTTGIVKLIAAVAAAACVASAGGGRSRVPLVGIPLMAGCANLWNLLDVRPGRALKYFLPVGVALVVVAGAGSFATVGAAAVGAAVGVLPFDLRERAMLGDSGANLLGFLVGVGLYRVLPLPGLVAALVAVLLLHVVSETITLSRVIAATPPLRWLDRVGRIPTIENGPQPPPS